MMDLRSELAQNAPLIALLVGVAVASFAYALAMRRDSDAARQQVEDRLWQYGNPDAPRKNSRHYLHKAMDWIEQTPLGRHVNQLMYDANLEWGLLTLIGITIGLFAVLEVLTSSLLRLGPRYNFILSAGGALALIYFFLRGRRGARERALQAQVPEIALLLSNAMRAGMSLYQALHELQNKLEQPAQAEFGQLAEQLDVGETIPDALQAFMDKHPGEEVRILMTALLIQTKAGGDLVKTLASISSAVQARQRLSAEIRTTSTEARYMAAAIVTLSVAILVILNSIGDRPLSRFVVETNWTAIGLPALDYFYITPGFLVFFVIYIIPQTLAFLLIRRVGNIRV